VLLVLEAAATLVLSLSRGSSGGGKVPSAKGGGTGSFSDCLRTDSCPNLSQPREDLPRFWRIMPGVLLTNNSSMPDPGVNREREE